jgi:hypothetical protein
MHSSTGSKAMWAVERILLIVLSLFEGDSFLFSHAAPAGAGHAGRFPLPGGRPSLPARTAAARFRAVTEAPRGEQ